MALTPLESITNHSTNVPFEVTGHLPGGNYYYESSVPPDADSLSETYTFSDSGWSVDWTIDLALRFLAFPISQSPLAGSDDGVSFRRDTRPIVQTTVPNGRTGPLIPDTGQNAEFARLPTVESVGIGERLPRRNANAFGSQSAVQGE